eukprot:6091987-Pleurochrysis_carterae.AAC.1
MADRCPCSDPPCPCSDPPCPVSPHRSPRPDQAVLRATKFLPVEQLEEECLQQPALPRSTAALCLSPALCRLRPPS